VSTHESRARSRSACVSETRTTTAQRRAPAFALIALIGCRGGDERAAQQDVAVAPAASRPPSVRPTLETDRSLVDEAVRAELDVDGLVVDLGSGDDHKYTRGGWRTGWGRPGSADGVTWTAITERRAWLDLRTLRVSPARIAMRARSAVPGQTITVHAGDRVLGSGTVGPRWTTLELPLDPAHPLDTGLRLELRTSRATSDLPRAEVDWIWLGRRAEPGEPALTARVATMNLGGVARRALAAPTPRSYDFHVIPSADASLVVDLGAERRGHFTVTAAVDGAPPVELLQETAGPGWTERVLPLAPFAGRPVRLTLRTDQHDGWAGWGEPELMVTPTPRLEGPPRTPAPRNAIVIVMDTARADGYGPFAGADRVAHTPVFDQLAARSVVFTSAYNNENWTKPSVATLLSGLYPSTHDTKRDGSELPEEVELVSQHLQRAGVATAGFVANGYVSDRFGFEKGWDLFRNYIRESRRSEAEHVYGDAVEWLEARAERHPDKPFFVYLQTIDAHVTYDVGREHWGRYFEGSYDGRLGPTISADDQVALSKQKGKTDPRDVAWLRALYWGEVTYHDEQLGTFLAELDRLGIRDDTLILITNDHGEELGERGAFGHGHQVNEEMIRAPLLLSHRSLPAGAVVRDVVEHVDVAPTVLDLLGRPPLAGADGMSFLPLARGQRPTTVPSAVIEFLDGRRVVRVGTWKLVATAGTRQQLHDLADDPGERHDLAATATIARRLCEIHLGEALAVPGKAQRLDGVGDRRQFEAGEARIGPQMRRQLEALGYLGSTPDTGDDADEEEAGRAN
jgi:choline-sulfatase